MLYIVKKSAFHLIVTLCFSNLGLTQSLDTRITEKDIKVEEMFVNAKLLVLQDKMDYAISVLDSIRRQVPDNGTVYFELARLYLAKNDFNLCEINIKKAIEKAPGNLDFKQFEYEFYNYLGRSEDARNTMTQMVTTRPDHKEYYDEIIDLDLNAKKYPSALGVLADKEKNTGWSIDDAIKRSEILELSGQVNQAVSILNNLSDKFPEDKKYLRLIVNVLHGNNRVAETKPYLEKILKIDPFDQDAELGLVLLSGKNVHPDDKLVTLLPLIQNPTIDIDAKIKEVLPFMEKQATSRDSVFNRQLINIGDALVSTHPQEAKAHALYADVLKNSGNLLAAIRQYEHTLELNKNVYLVWEQLLFCLEAEGKYEDQYFVARDAVDYFPNQPLLYYFAGKATVEIGNLKNADSWLDEAVIIAADDEDIESRVAVVRALKAFKEKDNKTANSYLDSALKLSKDANPDAWELKGDIFYQSGKVKDAKSAWETALKRGGYPPRIVSKLQSINEN